MLRSPAAHTMYTREARATAHTKAMYEELRLWRHAVEPGALCSSQWARPSMQHASHTRGDPQHDGGSELLKAKHRGGGG